MWALYFYWYKSTHCLVFCVECLFCCLSSVSCFMLPVSLDYPFLIAPSVFSYIYLKQLTIIYERNFPLPLTYSCDPNIKIYFLHYNKRTAEFHLFLSPLLFLFSCLSVSLPHSSDYVAILNGKKANFFFFVV